MKVVPYRTDLFSETTVVLRLRNASTYNFRAKIERNEFTTILEGGAITASHDSGAKFANEFKAEPLEATLVIFGGRAFHFFCLKARGKK